MSQQTIYGILRQAAEQHAGRTFCIERRRFRRKVWTYDHLMQTADRIALLMVQRGLRPGERVGICAPNGPWWLAIYIACAKSGLTIIPIDVNSAASFIETVGRQTDMKLLFKSVYKPLASGTQHKLPTIEVEQLIELLPPHGDFKAAAVKPDDTLEIVFTSGSTGNPKGVVLSHRNVTANVANLRQSWPIGSNHRMLSMIPLSHMFEQTAGFLMPFVAGSQVVYVESVRPFQVIQALQSEEITTIVTVPAFLSLLRRRILESAQEHNFAKLLQTEMRYARWLPRPIRRYMFEGILLKLGPSLKLVAVGGSALPPELEDFWETLGIHIIQGYGLTETSPVATYSNPDNKRRGSVGRCLPHQKLQLAADGEILLGGDNLFGGYLDNPTETAKALQDGWYHTGDIGRLAQDGYLYITGRKKNMLLSESGLNIYPEDIELVLASDPAIRESVVTLTKVDGQDTLTAVVLTTADEDKLVGIIRQANAKLASHQTIQRTITWPEDDFPRTPTRKVKRQIVVDTVSARADKKIAAADKLPSNISQLQLLVASIAALPAARIKPDSNLVSDLGFDSLKRLELVSKIEEDLGAYLDETAINSSTSYADLDGLVSKAVHQPKARLFNFSFFESFIVSSLRAIFVSLLLPLASRYQKLQADWLPETREPVVYIANHTSHFDAITIMRLLLPWRRRTILFGAASDYFFDKRLKGILLRLLAPVIPVDRQGNIQHTLTQLGAYLDDGYSIVLFPEGTRSTTGKILPFKPGIGVIAQELEAAIVPLRLVGNDTILPKGRKWPHRGTTTVHVGQPMIFGRDGDYKSTVAEIEKAVHNL